MARPSEPLKFFLNPHGLRGSGMKANGGRVPAPRSGAERGRNEHSDARAIGEAIRVLFFAAGYLDATLARALPGRRSSSGSEKLAHGAMTAPRSVARHLALIEASAAGANYRRTLPASHLDADLSVRQILVVTFTEAATEEGYAGPPRPGRRVSPPRARRRTPCCATSCGPIGRAATR